MFKIIITKKLRFRLEIFSIEVLRDTLNVIIHHFVHTFKKKASRITDQLLCHFGIVWGFLNNFKDILYYNSFIYMSYKELVRQSQCSW